MVSPKKKGNNDYINKAFQHTTRCKTRLGKKKEKKEKKKGKENDPQTLRAADAVSVQCGWILSVPSLINTQM